MPSSDSPIVVGGCHRSGTSLVRRILDSHPRIYCGPEVKFFRDFHGDYIDADDSIGHARFLTTARTMLPGDELLEALGGAFVDIHERAARAAGKARWADKVPENVVFLDEWQRLLGDGWTFLHVVRDPLDTLASIKEHPFPKVIPAALEDRIDFYLEYTHAGLRFADDHPDRYVRLVYEDLIEEPGETVRGLMASLGESFHPVQLMINSSPHQPGLEDPKAIEASEIYASSVGRWQTVLSKCEAELIRDKTAAVWSQLNR